jgi:hypothetical protein
MNSAIHRLYSSPKSVYQYRENLTSSPDVLYTYHKDIYRDNSIYIEIPEVPEIITISDIRIESSGKYEIIADKQIIGEVSSILVKKYKKVTIRVYDIENYEKFNISFCVTLAKNSIRSCL